MTTYYIDSENGKDGIEYFVMRLSGGEPQTASGPHRTLDTAWNSAAAKAKSEAAKTGQDAIYTFMPQDEVHRIFPDDSRGRAAWLVK